MADLMSIVSLLISALKGSHAVWEYVEDIRDAPKHIRTAYSNLRACRSTLDKLRLFTVQLAATQQSTLTVT